MASRTEETGSIGVNAGQTNVSITANTTLTVPTATQRPKRGMILQCVLSLEAQNARYRYGTAATAGTGVLLAAPAVIVLRGERQINAFNIISVVAGGVINYEFSFGDPT